MADVVPSGELERLRDTIDVLTDPDAMRALSDAEPAVVGIDAVCAIVADRIARGRARAGPSDLKTETVPKFFSRDSGTAVTFRNEAIVIETTKYHRYERVRELVRLAVGARQAASPVDGIDRVGLRYIDEIRVPDMDPSVAPTAWAPWIGTSLLGPLALGEDLGLTPAQMQGLALFETAPGQSLVLRYGPREGYAVNPDGDLKRTTTPPGPFFLLDIDSFWTAVEETPEPDLEWVLDLCDKLHTPVRTLFERLITDRLREEVLRDGH